MNIDKIHDILLNPNYLYSKGDEIELNDLNNRYPYCQLFTMMYLNVLNKNKDINFETELNKNAYKIRDRKKLYFLVNNLELNSNQELKIVNKLPEFLETKSTEIKVVVQEEKNDKKVNIEEKNVFESVVENEENGLNNNLEKEYLSSIMSSSYQISNLEDKKIDVSVKRSFTDWLKVNDESEKNNELTLAIPTKNIEVKVKKEIYSPIKKAKESVKEDKLLYSETLANIYIMQGNYPKAIEAFKQLMLSIPEKNVYFAKKIEELTIKINKQ